MPTTCTSCPDADLFVNSVNSVWPGSLVMYNARFQQLVRVASGFDLMDYGIGLVVQCTVDGYTKVFWSRAQKVREVHVSNLRTL